MSIIRESTPKREWVPLYVCLTFLYSYTDIFLPRPIPFSIGIGLLYAATVFPVLAPLPPALAGQALAFLVFVRNFGNILGITVGASFPVLLYESIMLTK
jgi:hypothetical protein